MELLLWGRKSKVGFHHLGNDEAMMYQLFFCLAIAMSLCATGSGVWAQSWELKKETPKFKAYSKGEGLKSYRIVGTLQADKECVLDYITDLKAYPKRFERVESVEILKQGQESTTYYVILDIPWPFDDRDAVSQVVVSRPTQQEIILQSDLTTHSNKPEKEGYVRVPTFKETYHIKQLAYQNVQVSIEGQADMGGNIPTWIQNLFTVDGPIKVMELMIAHCEQP